MWNLLVFLLVLALPYALLAAERRVTLTWSANDEPDLEGYRLYFRIGASGNRVLGNYDGRGLTFVGEPYDGQTVDSGFAMAKWDLPDPGGTTVTCTLGGLSDGEEYYFAITAYDIEDLESDASIEVSIANWPLASGSPDGRPASGSSGGGAACLIATGNSGLDIRVRPPVLLSAAVCVVLVAVFGFRRPKTASPDIS